MKKMKVALEEKLELETIRYAATEQHNIQLNNLVQQFKEKVVNFEKKLELQKGKLVMPDLILLLECLNFELHISCLWYKRQLMSLSTCMCDAKILRCA